MQISPHEHTSGTNEPATSTEASNWRAMRGDEPQPRLSANTFHPPVDQNTQENAKHNAVTCTLLELLSRDSYCSLPCLILRKPQAS